MITEILCPDVLKEGHIRVGAKTNELLVVLAETASLFSIGLSSTSRLLWHVHFKSVNFCFINARFFSDRPPFYYITFGSLKIRDLYWWTSDFIKQIIPIVSQYPVYVCLVASKYGKMYHVKGNFSTVRVGFKNFSTNKKFEHVHWHAFWSKCFSMSSFAMVFSAFITAGNHVTTKDALHSEI